MIHNDSLDSLVDSCDINCEEETTILKDGLLPEKSNDSVINKELFINPIVFERRKEWQNKKVSSTR